ncbi:probable apyrase 6 [Ricinus communis]|uniref:probable apyrase 6 n=1 Tax=Ricinus communis TaxID=3988 RepID=UPI00201A7277|nr:probable apyrase 6 [Ricinus communis]
MDFSSSLQSRPSYFPPHRTQLHPRMHINSFSSSSSPSLQNSNNNNNNKSHFLINNNKCLILSIALLTFPFLFYLFSTAQKIHHSSKFAEPKSQFFSIVIDSGPSGSRVRVFELLTEGVMPFGNGQMPLVAGSLKVRPGLAGFSKDPKNASGLIDGLVQFAKDRVPKKQWGNTEVQLLANAEDMERLEFKVKEMILESCRRVLRESGFVFKDEWARIMEDKEKGVYAWVAINYAFGTLGGDAQKTTGIVELGATSLQATFTSRRVAKGTSLRTIKLAGVTYNLQTQSFPKFSQDEAWESLHKLHNSRQLVSSSSNRVVSDGNPCIPKGFEIASNTNEAQLLLSHSAGNFTACRLEALSLLKSQQEKCLHPPCNIVPSFFLELQGKPISQESLFYTSEFFGLVPSTLFELEAAGKHFCEGDWDNLKSEHHGIDDSDLMKYCFSSAYVVALLHDSLGISMNDKRIGFANYTGSYPLDWTLGAFILQSMLEPLDMKIDNMEQIVGNEWVTYFSLFAFLLIALLAVLFVLQWRKPQLKTIYDLEKGHYIVTRVPR